MITITHDGPLTQLRKANERTAQAALEAAVAVDLARLRASLPASIAATLDDEDLENLAEEFNDKRARRALEQKHGRP